MSNDSTPAKKPPAPSLDDAKAAFKRRYGEVKGS